MLDIFSSFLSSFNVISKKKKERSSRRRRHLFLRFYVDLQKKKRSFSEFCKFSPRFVRQTRARRCEPQLSMVIGGKQKRWFLVGEKTPKFAKFWCKMPEKISHFNALKGNTGYYCKGLRASTEQFLRCFGKKILIVITFYLPSCVGQETAKGPFGLRVKLPPAHLSITHGEGFTLSLLMLNVKRGSCEYQFL